MIRSAFLSTTFIGLVAIGFSSFATSPSSSSSCSIELRVNSALGFLLTQIDGSIASTTCIQDTKAYLDGNACFININAGGTVNVTVAPYLIVSPKSQTINMTCNADVGIVDGSIVLAGIAYQSYTSTCSASITSGITYSGCGTVNHY